MPLFVIDEAVERIRDGSITDYVYDSHAVRLVKTTLATREKHSKKAVASLRQAVVTGASTEP